VTIALVRQEDNYGCMIAACAMVLGKSYRETKALIHPWHNLQEENRRGIGMGEMDGLLVEHGYAISRRFEHYHVACCQRPKWPPQPWADVHICEVVTGGPHAVVMLNDGRILDPAAGERPSLSEYSRVMWVAGVHLTTRRICGFAMPEFVGPSTTGRKRSTLCMCADAWPPEEAAA
jgi:hypothetical protein